MAAEYCICTGSFSEFFLKAFPVSCGYVEWLVPQVTLLLQNYCIICEYCTLDAGKYMHFVKC